MARARPLYPDAPRPTTFDEGQKYQDFICWQLLQQRGLGVGQNISRHAQFTMGENIQGIEIKFDGWTTKRDPGRNRLSIEIGEKSRNDPALRWTPSGIYRPDNSWLYIHGDYTRAYAFSKKLLKIYHARYETFFPGRRLEFHEEYGTLRAFYMYEVDAKRFCEFLMDFPPEAQAAFHGGWAR